MLKYIFMFWKRQNSKQTNFGLTVSVLFFSSVSSEVTEGAFWWFQRDQHIQQTLNDVYGAKKQKTSLQSEEMNKNNAFSQMFYSNRMVADPY